MSKSQVVQLRVSADELATWREEAQLAGLSLSRFVRDAANAKARLAGVLREEGERRREDARRRRVAAERLAASMERRSWR